MTTHLILFALCGLATFAFGTERSENPFFKMDSDAVARVELYEYVEPFVDPFTNQPPKTLPKGIWKTTGVVITNSTVIAGMVKALSEVTLTNNFTYPGIGILGHQFYFGKKGELLAITTIVNYRATVLVGLSPDDDSHAGARSDQFCRIVYDIMKSLLPKRIAALDALYKDTPGKSLEALLFDKAK
jgi:hypothetical protein